jgi:HlyD family secretion protein
MSMMWHIVRLDPEKVRDVVGLGGKSVFRHPLLRSLAWAAMVVAALLLGYLGLQLATGGQVATDYVTQPAETGSLTVIVTATGSVQPTNIVEVSSELSGLIREVLVDFNDQVKAGQPLAKLDTDKLSATVENSRAKLNAARAKAEEAEATIEERRDDYQRKQAMSAKQLISVQDLVASKSAYDRAVAARSSALAEIEVARADLRLNETNLSKACICAPISGVVLERNVEPGQTVAATLEAPVLFTIAEDLKRMELQVALDEADVGKVRVGQKATFRVDAYPDRKFVAEVQTIHFASETVQGVVTYQVILTADNSELMLRPGMTATAEIVVEEVREALLVPNAALRFTPESSPATEQSRGLLDSLLPRPPRFRASTRPADTGAERAVWVLRDDVPVEVFVTTGASDGRKTQILKGEISPGERVIVDTVADAESGS